MELRNVTATATTNITSTITGIPNYRIENLTLNNIDITFPGGMAALSDSFVVPENVAGKPEADIFGDTLPGSGLYLRHLDSVTQCNLSFHAQQPDQRPTVFYDDVQHLDTSNNCNTSIATIDEEAASFSVSPNPFSNQLQITSAQNQRIELFDLQGASVAAFQTSAGVTTLDLSRLAKGVYIIKSAGAQRPTATRIVKL